MADLGEIHDFGFAMQGVRVVQELFEPIILEGVADLRMSNEFLFIHDLAPENPVIFKRFLPLPLEGNRQALKGHSGRIRVKKPLQQKEG